MLKERSQKTSGWIFAAFVFGIIGLAAVPGFTYFYFIRESQLHVAVIAGSVLGMFLLVAFDPIIAVFVHIYRAVLALVEKTMKE